MLEARCDEVMGDYANGYSIRQIARRYDVSHNTVRFFLIAKGVPLRLPKGDKPPKLAARSEEIVAMHRNGKGILELARCFESHPNTIRRVLDLAGVPRRTKLMPRLFHIAGEANKGILAGLVMGEGSIIFRKNGASVQVINTDPDILGWCARWGGRVRWNRMRCRNLKPCGIWELARAVDAFHCLMTIMPLMVGTKRTRAEEAVKRLVERYGFTVDGEAQDDSI